MYKMKSLNKILLIDINIFKKYIKLKILAFLIIEYRWIVN